MVISASKASSTINFQSMEASHKLELARKMILHGFIKSIIESQAAISNKTLRKLRQEMGAVAEETPDRIVRGVSTIISNSQDRKNAAILLYAYVAMLGSGEVDIDTLIAAYRFYLAAMDRQRHNGGPYQRVFTINEAYSLVTAYRASDITLEACSRCGTPYAIFYNTGFGGCPNSVQRIALHDNALDRRAPSWPRMKKGSIYAQMPV